MVIDKKPRRAGLLVVDDDEEMLRFLKEKLTARGFQVDTANSGGEAIEKVQIRHFDLVICDFKMPVIDGIATLERVRDLDPTLQVIMISGQSSLDDAVLAMKEGAYDFLQKPVVMDALFFRIEKALEKRRLESMLAIYESGKAIFSNNKLEKILESILKLLTKDFHADEGSFMLVGPEEHLYIAASFGLADEVVHSTIIKLGERVAGLAAKEKRSYLLTDGLEHYAEFLGIESKPRIRSSLIIPVYHINTLLGVLNLNRTGGHKNFSLSELRDVSVFASKIAQVIENARLYKTLEEKMKELKSTYTALEESKNLLVQKEKLATLGSMMAGVAHEIGNPLTTVMGYIEMLLHSSEPREEVQEHLGIVYKEAERCSTIIHDLLQFSRHRSPRLVSFDVRQVIAETLDLMKIEIENHKIHMGASFGHECPKIFADPDQLKQVFLNLIKNAVQAMSGQTDKRIQIRIFETEKYLCIEISDNGSGISPDNLKKLFTPFFTTKENKNGTGLGLSISHEIIQAHGGLLTAKSKSGHGAVFTIELPLISQKSI